MTATPVPDPMVQLDLLLQTAANAEREYAERSQLDQLLEDSRLYRTGADYQALLSFVVRMRNFAPFNAMLLQLQKPGLMYAAAAHDWEKRFGRTIKEGARPLLILWPFGPVRLVYDVADTEGPPLPDGVSPFAAIGSMDGASMFRFRTLLMRKQIEWMDVDAGDGSAGRIQLVHRGTQNGADGKGAASPSVYRVQINRNHVEAVRFATLAHELGHLCLGHLGRDRVLNIPLRTPQTHTQRELEAESVAYVVCLRQGITPNSHVYLSDYVDAPGAMASLDLYQVMRAAGQVETLLGLGIGSGGS